MFSKLRLPVRQKQFKSGLIVIMDSSSTEEVIERNILRFITEKVGGGGITALEVGAKFNWSVGVAVELLQVTNTPCWSLFSRSREFVIDDVCRWLRRRDVCVGMLLLRGYDFGRIDLWISI